MAYRTVEVVLAARDTNLTSTLTRAGAAVNTFEKRAESAGKSVESSGRASQVLAGSALAVAAGLGYAVNQAAKFDSSMHNVNSLMGLSQRQLAGYSKQVLSMSTRLPQSATQLADGLYQIASSGFAGQQGLQVLNSAATAASAGLTDTNTAAEAIVAVLHSYGLAANQAGAVSDTLFQTVNLGVLSFEDLAQGMGQVVGIASTAHVSLREVGAAVATMTRTGVRPAESFTSLNQLITRLIKPTDALQDVYKRLGYQSGEAALAQKGLGGVMADINRVTGGSASATVTLMGDIRAARGAFAFGAQGGHLYSQMLKQMGQDSGSTGKVLAEQSKSASYQFNLLKNDVNEVAIELGTAMLPALVKGASGLQHMIHAVASGSSQISPLTDSVGDLISNLFRLAGAVQGGLAPLEHLALAGVVGSLTAVAQVLSQITGFASDHAGAVTALVAALAGLKIAGIASGGLKTLAARGGLLDDLAIRAMYAKDSVAQIGTGFRNGTGPIGKFGGAMKGVGGITKSVGGGLMSLAGGPLGITTGVVLAGVVAWQQYEASMSAINSEAESFGASQKKAFDPWKSTPKLLGSVTDAFDKQAKKTKESQDHISGWSKAWGAVSSMIKHTGPGGIEKGLVDFAGDQGEAFRTLSTNLKSIKDQGRAYSTTMSVMASQTGMTTGEVRRLGQQSKASDALVRAASGTYRGQAQATLLMKAGVDSTAEAQAKLAGVLNGQAATNQSATSSQLALSDAENVFADASSNAADKATALSNAIKGLVTPGIDLQQSVQAWEEALSTAVATAGKAKGVGIDPLTGAFKTNTKAGKDAASNMNAIADGFMKSITGLAQAGRPVSNMNNVLSRTMDTFRKAGEAAGLSKPQIDAYARTLGLVPDTVQTVFKEYNGDKVKQKAQDVHHEINKVPKELSIQAKALNTDDVMTKMRMIKSGEQSIPGTKNIQVNTPGAREAALELVNATRKANGLPPLKTINTKANTSTAISNLLSLRSTIQNTPGDHSTEMKVIDNALATIRTIAGEINNIPASKSTTVTVTHAEVYTRSFQYTDNPISRGPRADGGIDVYADGGTRMPKQAIIARKAGRRGLVQWAEDSTGGEAYIPMGESKRQRSTDILAEVAHRFGFMLTDGVESFATGGMTAYQRAKLAERNTATRPGSVNSYGGLTAYQRAQLADARKADARRQTAAQREAAQRAREAAQAKKDRQQEHTEWLKQNARLRAPIKLEPSSDLSSLLGNTQTAAETLAQNRAELHARLSPNTHDVADDYYREPTVRLGDYRKTINQSTNVMNRWRSDISKIAAGAGYDVAYQLQQMGDAGIDIVRKMASSTKGQMQQMAKDLRNAGTTAFRASQDFQLAMTVTNRQAQRFNSDIMTLIGRGNVDLAAYLKNMGVEEGGQIARRAVEDKGAAARLTATVRAANAAQLDEKLSKALDLAALLAGNKTPLGITGLANSSGDSIADVWTLLTQYNGQVFSRLAGSKMSAIRKDQQLVKAGRPLTGLSEGAIIRGNNTGMYRVAEPYSGGESMIPHGTRQRARAVALWRETGRIIGQQVGGAVRMVAVADGAVRVQLTINGSNLSAQQVQQIADRSVASGMTQLVRKIKSGSR